MIKVYKDVLQKLEIQNIFLSGEKNAFCNLVEINGQQWMLAVDTEFNSNSAVLNIKIKDSYIEIPVKLQKTAPGLYSVDMDKKSNKKKVFTDLLKRIALFEEECSLWEKRKEERYSIGLTHSKDFFLDERSSKVIVDRAEQPAFINNVSLSGVNLTTLSNESQRYKKGQTVLVVLKFSNPIEQVAFQGSVQSVVVKTVKNSNRFVFVILSLRIIDPPLSYKKRVGNYIQTLGGK